MNYEIAWSATTKMFTCLGAIALTAYVTTFPHWYESLFSGFITGGLWVTFYKFEISFRERRLEKGLY